MLRIMSFVRFLGEIMAQQLCFDINWPLNSKLFWDVKTGTEWKSKKRCPGQPDKCTHNIVVRIRLHILNKTLYFLIHTGHDRMWKWLKVPVNYKKRKSSEKKKILLKMKCLSNVIMT